MSQHNFKTYSHFTQEKRIKLEQLLDIGWSKAKCAKELEVNRSTIGREIKRGWCLVKTKNNNFKKYESEFFEEFKYRASYSQSKYRTVCWYKIDKFLDLTNQIETLINIERKSPEIVANKIENKICTKTIYNNIAKGILKIPKLIYKPRKKYLKPPPRVNKRRLGTSIGQRPMAINERKEFGHMEADLVIGRAIDKEVTLTLTERTSRQGWAIKLENKKSETVLRTLKEFVKNHKWVKSITFDNGTEFADAHKLDVLTYFTHPYSSWEKGGIENWNRMLRRWIKKGRSLKNYSQKQIDDFVNWINNYERKIFGFKTSQMIYSQKISSLSV